MSDLLPLTRAFVAKFSAHSLTITPEAAAVLKQHSWPGNVREVRSVIERASILVGTGREIRPEHILI